MMISQLVLMGQEARVVLVIGTEAIAYCAEGREKADRYGPGAGVCMQGVAIEVWGAPGVWHARISRANYRLLP